jgi:hypothetical protein
MKGLTRQQATANAITIGELRALLVDVTRAVAGGAELIGSRTDAELEFMAAALSRAGRPDLVQDYRALLLDGQDDAVPLRWADFESAYRRVIEAIVAERVAGNSERRYREQ